MTALDIDTVLGWRGRTVRDADGDKVGTFGDVFLDRKTDQPAWGGVRTGLLGRRESFVPLSEVREEGDDLHVPYTADQVKGAPSVDPDVALTEEEERSLYRHYGQDYGQPSGAAEEAQVEAGTGAVAAGRAGDREAPDVDAATEVPTAPGDADREATGAEPDAGGATEADAGGATDADAGGATDADAGRPIGQGEMVRSEEEVRVRPGPMRPKERVRLRKVLVTDHVERTVPVRKEVVELETDPPAAERDATDADAPGRDRPPAGGGSPPA